MERSQKPGGLHLLPLKNIAELVLKVALSTSFAYGHVLKFKDRGILLHYVTVERNHLWIQSARGILEKETITKADVRRVGQTDLF